MTTAKPPGHTRTTQGEAQAEEGDTPRLPHEHDESSDSQHHGEPRAVMRKAHDDVVSGRVDTDRGPAMEEAYRRQKEARPPRKRS